MVRKKDIIKHYLKNQTKSLEELSEELDVNKSQVSQAVSSYFESLNIGKDIGFCFSFSFPQNLGYIFDDYREREVLIEDNEILNKSDFTQYELLWLLENYGLGEYNKTEKFNYLEESIKELKKQRQNTINFAEKKKLKEKINCLESI